MFCNTAVLEHICVLDQSLGLIHIRMHIISTAGRLVLHTDVCQRHSARYISSTSDVSAGNEVKLPENLLKNLHLLLLEFTQDVHAVC